MSLSNSIHIISYHIFIFTKHAKKHINRHVKGENSQKAKRGQKRAITQLRKKTTSNLPTKESNTRKKNKLTLPSLQTLQETKSTTHQAHHYPTLAHSPHTLTQKQDKTKQKQNIKTSQAPKILKKKKKKILFIVGCCIHSNNLWGHLSKLSEPGNILI